MQELPKLPIGWIWKVDDSLYLTPTAYNEVLGLEVWASSLNVSVQNNTKGRYTAVPNEVVLAVLMLAAKLT